MKILYLCFDPSIDLAGETGGSVHVRAMIRALTELGHQVMTICTCVSRQQWVESQVGGRVTSCAISGWNDSLGSANRRANRFLQRQPRHYTDAVRYCLYRLAENPTLREELGRNARSASQAFTWERNAARVVEWAEPKVVQGRLRTVCA